MLTVTAPKSTEQSLHDQIKVSEIGQCGQQRFALLSSNCALCLEIGLGLVPSPTRVQGAPDQFSVLQGHQAEFGPGYSSFCLPSPFKAAEAALADAYTTRQLPLTAGDTEWGPKTATGVYLGWLWGPSEIKRCHCKWKG